jgi:hypothetical protein
VIIIDLARSAAIEVSRRQPERYADANAPPSVPSWARTMALVPGDRLGPYEVEAFSARRRTC